MTLINSFIGTVVTEADVNEVEVDIMKTVMQLQSAS